MGIGARLIEERERLGLSQAEFAALAGLSDRAQRMYEKDERHPDTSYLLAVAAGGADVVYLLTGQRGLDMIGALTAEEASIVDHYRAATDDGRAAARAVLHAVEKQPARPAKRAVGE